jgi:prepilin-type N-terminal cleavage/methylation domain-containing protein
MLKQKGFSLIELLIVIAIILVIAAIAIPNLLRARMAANDSSAACLLDQSLAGGGPKSGYSFTATGSAGLGSPINNQFYATGTPISAMTGTRAYCSVEDLVIRLQPAGNTTLVATYAACRALSPASN